MNIESFIEHEKIKGELYNLCKFNRLPTGILLLGPEGCGNFKLGIKFIKKLLKIDILTHPDIYFLFPLPNLPKSSKLTDYFYNKWHNFLVNQPYGSFLDWKKKIHYENKDCKISLEQLEEALKMINLKSYELSHKVVIFWMLEHLNINAANKLLNVLDSPPKQVFFLFIGENENLILPTLKSRLLIIKFQLIYNKSIEKYLILKFNLSKKRAQNIVSVSEGNLNTIFKILKNKKNTLNINFLNINFIFWMRMLFNLKNKIDSLLIWSSQINSWNRDKKKSFLLFSLEIFRIAHRYKYDKNYRNPFFNYKNFNWKQFCIYINTKKVSIINYLISDVIKGIDRYYFFLFNFLYLSFNINKILFNKL
ncbi:DNA polymerase III subunit delta [Candidatus Karelsulcia muelleri]|uniref:DNA polymerase III subunit delta' n=1 Tax=Candidatus Karelsulcia muelleri TaxID=336810 RepID=UPI001FF60190|nr:DNA polymerase III subunit delta' [Candidatus Karelsulcia muelleri]UOQ27710.1 DNA polymerase III subunit delta [Candidatus Karelsulcia muelleri]